MCPLSSNKALTPRYGDAPKGQRCHGEAPRNRGRNPSILAAMGPDGLVGTMTVEGSTNTEVFLTYLARVLCPALRPGQTVGLDNPSVHKNEAVRTKIWDSFDGLPRCVWFAFGISHYFAPRFEPVEK